MALLNQADNVFIGNLAVEALYKGGNLVWDGTYQPPTSAYPLVHTFTDTFDTLDATKWTIYPGAAALSGELTLDASSSYSTIRTTEYYSIEGSAVQIQVNQLPNVSNGSTQAWMNFRLDTSNYTSFLWSNGTLYSRMMLAGTQTDTQVTYDVATMSLWRLRELNGTLYWETSSDGATWVEHRTVAMPSSWVGMGGQISLVAGNWNSASSPGQAKFDNLNVDDFIEVFTAADGSVWSADRWTLTPQLNAATDVLSNRGRLSIPDTDGAMVRAIAETPTMTNQNLLMSYTLTDTSARTWIQIWLRSDGTWSGNKPGSGYAVEIQSDASSVAILKYVAGTQTSLSKITGVNSLTANQKQWLRFEANGTVLRYKIWTEGTAEPVDWTASVTDSQLTTPGRFQFCAYRSTANIGAKTVYFDDISIHSRVSQVLDKPDSGTGVVLNEQFDGNYNLTYDNNGSHPNVWLEWRETIPVDIAGGVMKLTGNTNSAHGFHRMFSRFRYGGPGKSIRIRYRARMTALYDDGGWGGTPGVKIGLKFPQPQSITGYSEEDPRSCVGGQGEATPGSVQFVVGLGPEGLMEFARRDYGNGTYLTPWAPNKKVGYSLNTWKDIVIQVDWVATDEMRVRYWHNADASGTPIYDWQGYAPFNEPGFLWYRTDFSDFEYDYMIVEEI